MTASLVQKVSAERVAFIGDVHGEHEALELLLERLERQGEFFYIFMGDLVDRGPDSLGVVRRVAELVKDRKALCLLGNHELNLLRGERKPGNLWFFGEDELVPGAHGRHYESRLLLNENERQECLKFFGRNILFLHKGPLSVLEVFLQKETY